MKLPKQDPQTGRHGFVSTDRARYYPKALFWERQLGNPQQLFPRESLRALTRYFGQRTQFLLSLRISRCCRKPSPRLGRSLFAEEPLENYPIYVALSILNSNRYDIPGDNRPS